MVVSTIVARAVSITAIISTKRVWADNRHTWPFSIVAVELGREASSYSHLDEENDSVQERLEERRKAELARGRFRVGRGVA